MTRKGGSEFAQVLRPSISGFLLPYDFVQVLIEKGDRQIIAKKFIEGQGERTRLGGR